MSDIKKKLEEWMVRVSFAEADATDAGFQITGGAADRKTKLALDRIRMVRSEREAGGPAPPPSPGAHAGAGVPSAAERALSVLLLDDEPIVGKRLKPALEKAGFVVECFTRPADAVARLEDREFDVVVTDLRMEGMDGIQFLEHVMAHCRRTRVILITGYATVEVAREALVKGAFDFISKPFKAHELKAVINKAALSLGHKGIG